MRARNLKPSFFTNEELADLPMAARLLFQGLWCMADRAGRLEDRPRRIKASILPYDDCDVDGLLLLLHDAGFIARYQHGTDRYIQVVNFQKHQNPHVKEAASSIPAPDEHSASTVLEPDEHGSSPADSLLLIPDSPLLTAEGREDAPAPAETDDSDSFELSPAERKIIANIQQIRGMAAVGDAEIARHFREIVAARGSPPSESAFIKDSMNFRDYWNEKRKSIPDGRKWAAWRTAMTNWFTRTTEVSDTRRSPHAAPKQPMGDDKLQSKYDHLWSSRKAAS